MNGIFIFWTTKLPHFFFLNDSYNNGRRGIKTLVLPIKENR